MDLGDLIGWRDRALLKALEKMTAGAYPFRTSDGVKRRRRFEHFEVQRALDMVDED